MNCCMSRGSYSHQLRSAIMTKFANSFRSAFMAIHHYFPISHSSFRNGSFLQIPPISGYEQKFPYYKFRNTSPIGIHCLVPLFIALESRVLVQLFLLTELFMFINGLLDTATLPYTFHPFSSVFIFLNLVAMGTKLCCYGLF